MRGVTLEGNPEKNIFLEKSTKVKFLPKQEKADILQFIKYRGEQFLFIS